MGVVKGVVGVAGFEVVILGDKVHDDVDRTMMVMATHTGNKKKKSRNPTNKRGDALAAAAEAILYIERMCKTTDNAQDGKNMLVCTVGQINMSLQNEDDNATAGSVLFAVDIRSLSKPLLQEKVNQIKQEIIQICAHRHVDLSFQVSLKLSVVNL